MSRARALSLIFWLSGSLATVGAEPKQIEGWGKFLDPDGDCSSMMQAGKLTIRVPGTPHDLSAELRRMNAPRVLREVKGDFAVEVKVGGKFAPSEGTIPERTPYQGAGLLLMKDDRTYVTLVRAVLVRDGERQHYANFEQRVDGELLRFGIPADFQIDDSRETVLRLERRGDKVLGSVSQEAGKWHELPPKQIKLPEEVSVGVAAVNASADEFSPRFADFKVSPNARK